jgi:glycosyltransferase involved in cell wall biosynthesis
MDQATPAGANAIDISVIIPVRNEEDSVRALLEGLLGQTLLPTEIVITDGGSSDATTDIIEEFIDAGAPVKLISEEDSLPGRSRNLAVRGSRCDWLAFIDAGIRPSPDWLETLTKEVGEGSDADVVYGSYEPVTDSFFKECAAIAYVPPPFETGSGPARPQSIVSALMRREVWDAVGGFPEDLRSAEDLIFMRRIQQAQFKIVRAPRALVRWDIQPNLRLTFRRFVRYSRHNIRAGLFNEWQMTIFIYYAIIAGSGMRVIARPPRWGALALPLILWLLLMLVRATKSVYRNRKNYPAGLARNIARVCVLVPILASIDAAAFIGSIDWLLRDKLGSEKREAAR